MIKESKESENAYNRYKQILDLLNTNKNSAGLKHLQDLVNLCERYIVVVANTERIGKLQRFRAQSDQEEIEEFRRLDHLRRITHNALIAQIKLVNRYLFRNYSDEIPIGGVYSLDPGTLADEDRNAIGEWAFHLVDALQRRGILKRD